MKKTKYTPYGIDLDYEFKTYKNVGKDYDDYTSTKIKFSPNLLRYYRKKNNKDNKKYAHCKTYTEWKNHVNTILYKDINNKEDLLHFLYRYENSKKYKLEIEKIILIPLYFIIITSFNYITNNQLNFGTQWFFETFIILLVAIYSTVDLTDAMEKIDFIKDFIEIAEEILKN